MNKAGLRTFESLKSKKAIGRLFDEGLTGRSGYIMVKALLSDSGAKIAFIAPKRTGNAVKRNRIKRRMRAAVRGVENIPEADLAIIARPEVLNMPFEKLVSEISQAIAKAVR